MSLDRFKINNNILHPILTISFINFILMLVILVMSTTILAKPSGVQMEFPSFKDEINSSGKNVVITVTSENVIYIDGRVVTLTELRNFLGTF